MVQVLLAASNNLTAQARCLFAMRIKSRILRDSTWFRDLTLDSVFRLIG